MQSLIKKLNNKYLTFALSRGKNNKVFQKVCQLPFQRGVIGFSYT